VGDSPPHCEQEMEGMVAGLIGALDESMESLEEVEILA
jgi:hypothetical protein